MSTIRLSDLTVRRGPGPVVQHLDIAIRHGSVFWIVGPNGAGKTSLLRVVAGLDEPANGAVERGPAEEPFRYFHSEMSLPGWSSVGAWDRLIRGLDSGAAGPTPLRPAVTGRRWVRQLSTGERKRLLLDALLRVPGSLLLDEPYEHLSPRAKSALSRLLRERVRGSVVVVVTNQADHRDAGEPGLRLEAGRAKRLAAGPRGSSSGEARAPEPTS